MPYKYNCNEKFNYFEKKLEKKKSYQKVLQI